MHVYKKNEILHNIENADSVKITNKNQQDTLFEYQFFDKNDNKIVDSFDFDNDQKIIQKLEEANLFGQLWEDVENKINLLLNKTDVWIVQNNQSISQIAIMILKQTKPDYTQKDIVSISEELIKMNQHALDGSKQGFLVNSKIKLPFSIDITNEKQSDNPMYDYVLYTQLKRINDIVSKYNLIGKNNINSQTYQDALSLSREFIKKYGYLNSESRERLILSPHFEISNTTDKNISAIRENVEIGLTANKISQVDKNVKKYKTANCGECSELLIKMCFEKFNRKYEISELCFIAFVSEKEIDHDHTALLLKSNISNEEYVVDMWVSPKNGAIFKRKDWENMVKEVFEIKNIEKIDFYEDTTIIEKLIKEKLLSDNYKLLSKEIPSKHLHTINRFVNYVSEELRKGNTFSPKVIEIFNHYKKNS